MYVSFEVFAFLVHCYQGLKIYLMVCQVMILVFECVLMYFNVTLLRSSSLEAIPKADVEPKSGLLSLVCCCNTFFILKGSKCTKGDAILGCTAPPT